MSFLSEVLTACSPADMIHNISTISKHLLEKSEAICCLLCLCLFGNVTWLHTNTSSQSFPLPSLKRDAERWRQGDSTLLQHGSTPSRLSMGSQPPPPHHPPPHVIDSQGPTSHGAQVTTGSGAEQSQPWLPAWICCSEKACHELTVSMLEVYH